MKRPLPILLIFICACTQKSTDQVSQKADSTDLATEAPSALTDLSPDSILEEFSDYDSASTEYLNCLTEKATALENNSVFHLTASYSGYESSQDVTYFYDSLFNLTYCNVSWSMEGSSGSYSYYFENENLIAGKEDNSYNAYDENTIFCKGLSPFVGLTSTAGETETDPVPLTESAFLTKNKDALNEYHRLLSQIAEYSGEATTDGSHTNIHIENIVNYGEDYTETEDFEISTPLYDALFQ